MKQFIKTKEAGFALDTFYKQQFSQLAGLRPVMRCQHCSQSSPLHSVCHTGSNDEECGFGGNDCSRSMQVAAILEPLFGFRIKILFGSKKEECVTAEQYRPAKIEKKD